MATSTNQKPRPVTSGDQDFNQPIGNMPRPDLRTPPPSRRSDNTLGYIIAALVALVAAYFLFTSYYTPAPTTPSVTETTPMAPAADAPVTTPPAATTETPPAATPPAATTETPPAAPVAPATPPAATTTP